MQVTAKAADSRESSELYHDPPMGSSELCQDPPMGSSELYQGCQWDQASCIKSYRRDQASCIKINQWNQASCIKIYQWNQASCIKLYRRDHHHHHHQSLNREGRWGTKDDFTTSFLHFSLFSTALWDLPNSRPVHSLMLSSHLFLCPPCLHRPFTVPCKMVLARPDERET